MRRQPFFFSELTLYQPAGNCLPADLEPWVEDGFLEVRVPVSDDGEMVAAAVREYREWARQHQIGRNLKSMLPQGPGRPPFFESTATAQILADLKGAGRGGAGDRKSLFAARLFLGLAQCWDQDQQELDRRLKRAEADARALLDELQSGKTAAAPAALRLPDGSRRAMSDFMLTERLDAWRRLFLADTLDTAVLLTTSPSIISDFVPLADAGEPLLRLNAAKPPRLVGADPSDSPRDSLMETLAAVCRRPRPFEDRSLFAGEDAGENADLTLFLIPNQSARRFMTGLKASPAPAGTRTTAGGTAPRHLIVGFLNPDGPGIELESGHF